MSLFIGVDCGSQGMKAVVIDGESGEVLGVGFQGYDLIQGLPMGHREQNPSVWIDAMAIVIRDAIHNVDVTKIRGIGVSGQQHGFVPLDSNGKVIRPAKLWNDISSIEECKWLINSLGGVEKVVELTGNTILPGFTAGKILWMKRNEPKNWDKLATVLLPHDYLNFWLTGVLRMEYGDASGTALINIRNRDWCHEVVDMIDPILIEKLPNIRPSIEPAGELQSEPANMLGLKEGILVSAGGGDNMMGAIGTGNTKPSIATISLGTSGTIYTYSSRPIVDPLGEVHAFCDSTGGWLPLACTMNVTVTTEIVRNLFGFDFNMLENSIESSPPGAGGLVLLPYLRGERVPNVPDGTGVLYGLNDETFKASYLTRAAVEGVTMGLNYGFMKMKKMGVEFDEVRLTGGGSHNKSWRRISADIFGTEIVCLKVDEGAAFGAALQSLWTYETYLGKKSSIVDITDSFVKLDEETRVKPITENVAKYNKIQMLQNKLSIDMRDLFRETSIH